MNVTKTQIAPVAYNTHLFSKSLKTDEIEKN